MRFLVFLLASAAYAQTSSGSISGTVYDPSGAVIPGAQIRLIGTETGDLVRSLSTGNTGVFSAPLLRPSIYTVEASAQGFKTLRRSGIILRVDDILALKLTLDPGATTESINVTATAELLEERSNAVGQVVDEKTMQQLPLNGRNYLQLAIHDRGLRLANDCANGRVPSSAPQKHFECV